MTNWDKLPPRLANFITPEPMSGCWLWTGRTYRHGYGRFMLARMGPSVNAHRIVYETLRGPIPEGLVLDHKCRVTGCCNPDHLEPVTQHENLHRSPIMRWKKPIPLTTHCLNGHPRDEANLRIDKQGNRQCRACHRGYMRQFKERKRQRSAA